MLIEKIKYEIINPFKKYLTKEQFLQCLLEHCEREARKSHQSENLIKEGSAEKLLKFIVMDKGDFSIIEHAYLTVDVIMDRGITHEQVRHRIASYTQESTRFVNYAKKKPASFVYPRTQDNEIDLDWLRAINTCEEVYQILIAKGWKPQEARSIMPNGQKSAIGITMNMRGWRHELIMRTTAEAHPQMREWTIPLLLEFKETCWKWLFDDIEPSAKQSENMRKMR